MTPNRLAAGLLLRAADTGRVLLLLRSKHVMEPHTWGLPGGLVDNGEEPVDTVLRELREETGYDGEVNDVRPLRTVRLTGRAAYEVFEATAPTEFEPELNWEHDEGAWFALDSLPKNLHPGLAWLRGSVRMTLLAYHGTHRSMAKPTRFAEPKGMDFGPGFYLALNPADAAKYGANVYEAEVELKNPIVLAPGVNDEVLIGKLSKALGIDEDEWLHDYNPKRDSYTVLLLKVFQLANVLIDIGRLKVSKWRDYLMKLGYDGIRVDRRIAQSADDYVVVFTPEQILSWKPYEAEMTPNAPAKRFEYIVKQYWDKPFGWVAVLGTWQVAHHLFGLEQYGQSLTGRAMNTAVASIIRYGTRRDWGSVWMMKERDARNLLWDLHGYFDGRHREQAIRLGVTQRPIGEFKDMSGPDILLLCLVVEVTRMPAQHENDFILPWVARELWKLKKSIEETGRKFGVPQGFTDQAGAIEAVHKVDDPALVGEQEAPPNWMDFEDAVRSLVQGGSAIATWAKETKTDLNKMSLDAVLEAVSKHIFKTKLVPQGKVVYEFPDGFTIQELPPEALKAEGEMMQHSVGSYCEAVQRGDTVIYSLRDQNGNPHATMEWLPEKVGARMYGRVVAALPGRFAQIYGKQNAPVVDKYKPYIHEFIVRVKGADPTGLNMLHG